jgi:hypothetical protein
MYVRIGPFPSLPVKELSSSPNLSANERSTPLSDQEDVADRLITSAL